MPNPRRWVTTNGWLVRWDVDREVKVGDLGMGAGRLLGRTSQLDVELLQIKRQNHMTINRANALDRTFLIRLIDLRTHFKVIGWDGVQNLHDNQPEALWAFSTTSGEHWTEGDYR